MVLPSIMWDQSSIDRSEELIALFAGCQTIPHVKLRPAQLIHRGTVTYLTPIIMRTITAPDQQMQ